jgi:predicted aspartyl protease
MLDTGFTGFLAINKQDLEGLYWQFLRKKVVGIFAFGGEFSSWCFEFRVITMS